MGKKRKAGSPLQASPPPAASTTSCSCRDSTEEIRLLRQQICDLQRRVDRAEEQQDALQQQGRLKCLIFSGPALAEPSQNEKTIEIIRDLLLNLMSYSLDVGQIECAFRLRGKSILMKFTSAASGSDRDNLFKTKTYLRGTGLYISESLTPRRQEIYRTLVKLKKEGAVKTTFTRAGDIFVRVSTDSDPIKITDRDALNSLLGALTRPRSQGHTRAAGDTTSQGTAPAVIKKNPQKQKREVSPAPVPAHVGRGRAPPLSAPGAASAQRPLDAPLPPCTSPREGEGDRPAPARQAVSVTGHDPGDPETGVSKPSASAGSRRDKGSSRDSRLTVQAVEAVFDEFVAKLSNRLSGI